MKQLGAIKVKVDGKDRSEDVFDRIRSTTDLRRRNEKAVLVLIHVCGYQEQQARRILGMQSIAKGDVPGHEFHGNQYTGGRGGGKDLLEPKGSISRKETWNRDQLLREARMVLQENYAKRGDSLATPDEFKALMGDPLSYSDIWKDMIEEKYTATLEESGYGFQREWVLKPIPPDEQKLTDTVLKDVAAHYGVPLDRIDVIMERATFSLNGKDEQFAGHYDPRTGRIGLYYQVLRGRNEIRQVLAHEFQHLKFNQLENTQSVGNPKHMWGYIEKNREKLSATDGVTSYSKDWWRAHNDEYATNGTTLKDSKGVERPNPNLQRLFRSAVNETLAEIAAVKTWSKPKEIHGVWQKLYDLTVSEYRKSVKGK